MIEEEKAVIIMCNDIEEREHIKHILLKIRFILCFEQESKRYWAKWAENDEKEDFRKVQVLRHRL